MPPEVMAEYAYRAVEEYPNKQLFLHFVQPHCPFIGETGRKNIDEIGWVGHVGIGETTGPNVSRDIIRRAYRENVDIVVPYARELMTELPGLNVVTSDHGQLLGDQQAPIPLADYGHPEGIYVDTLVRVPWISTQVGERNEITAEPPHAQRRTAEIGLAAQEALKQLGYLN
jgi:hypothetical protein